MPTGAWSGRDAQGPKQDDSWRKLVPLQRGWFSHVLWSLLMSFSYPHITELDAQRADLACLAPMLPDEVFSSLVFKRPEASSTVNLREPENFAAWAYYGVIMMPFNSAEFKKLSHAKHFEPRLESVIDDLRSIRRSVAEERDLLLYESISQQLEQGVGHQKRADLYAKFLDYNSFNDFLKMLDRVNFACKAKGAFSYVTLVKPGSYFRNRVDDPRVKGLFAHNQIDEFEAVLKELSPFWLDVVLLFLEKRFVGWHAEPIAGHLVLFKRNASGSVAATEISHFFQESGTRWVLHPASTPNKNARYNAIFNRARQLFGDVEINLTVDLS